MQRLGAGLMAERWESWVGRELAQGRLTVDLKIWEITPRRGRAWMVIREAEPTRAQVVAKIQDAMLDTIDAAGLTSLLGRG